MKLFTFSSIPEKFASHNKNDIFHMQITQRQVGLAEACLLSWCNTAYYLCISPFKIVPAPLNLPATFPYESQAAVYIIKSNRAQKVNNFN